MISQVAGTLAAHALDRIEVLTTGGVTYEILVPLSVVESVR